MLKIKIGLYFTKIIEFCNTTKKNILGPKFPLYKTCNRWNMLNCRIFGKFQASIKLHQATLLSVAI